MAKKGTPRISADAYDQAEIERLAENHKTIRYHASNGFEFSIGVDSRRVLTARTQIDSRIHYRYVGTIETVSKEQLEAIANEFKEIYEGK